MVEHFFSTKYADRGELFEGLSIWEDEEFRKLQGIYPVISLSFANVKEPDYETTRRKICQLLINLYVQNSFLLDSRSLLLASGYLEVETYEAIESDYDDRQSYELVLTNHEVTLMFQTRERKRLLRTRVSLH